MDILISWGQKGVWRTTMKFSELCQRKCWRNASREKVNEKCVFVNQKLIITKPRCDLNRDTTGLWNLGIIPTNSNYTTTGLVRRRGSASIPKILQTKQFVWQLDFHSVPWTEASVGLCLESATVGQQTQDYSPPRNGDVVKYLVSKGGISRPLAIASKCYFALKRCECWTQASVVHLQWISTVQLEAQNGGYCNCYRSWKEVSYCGSKRRGVRLKWQAAGRVLQ